MPQSAYMDYSWHMAGLWYYHMRTLPLKQIAKERGKLAAELLKRFEIYARLKWKNPSGIAWSADDFQKQMARYRLNRIAEVYHGFYNLPIIVPRTLFFYNAFSAYPNLNTVYGERGAGKTFFAWRTAWETYKRNHDKYDEFQIIVFGDIDGLTKEIQKYHPDPHFRKSLIMMEDYEEIIPEKHIAKFIIYNELDDPVMSESSLSKEGRIIKKMIWRSRHYEYWMIYNIIRIMSVQKTIRMSASFQSFKNLSRNLLEEVVEKGINKYLRPVFLEAEGNLRLRESLTFIPLYRADKMKMRQLGSKDAFTITPIKPPEWLLKALETAEKNFDVGSTYMQKKEKELVQKAAELYLEGNTLRVIAIVMKRDYGYDRSHSWWRDRLMDYFAEMGYNTLQEVKNDVLLGRISPQVLRRKREADIQP